MFVPIKVTTDYSMMNSLITVPSLIQKLISDHITVCGICDQNLYGVMEFYNACQGSNIKPLIGLEVTVENMELYLYARDYNGYLELLKIHTKKEMNTLNIQDIKCLTEHINLVLPFNYIEHYENFVNIKANVYIGYTSEYEKNNAYIVTENVIFCPNIKCFKIEDGMYLNILYAIDKNESFTLIEKKDYTKNSWEYLEQEEIINDKTKEFIASINIEIPKTENYIPKFDEKIDSTSYLNALAKKGLLKRKNNNVPASYQNRLNYELKVIRELGFSDYFLIVYDYVRFAKQNGILVGAGRGSAVGSLVSYCLGITDVDPLEYNLLFERFLNPERVTMPDIDVDFEETRREEVVNYVKDRYGKSCVANIITFGTLKSKLVLRSVGKALDINPSIVDHFVNLIDAKITLQENLKNDRVSYYANNNKDIHKIVIISLKLEGLKKHVSTHAAGVVIASKPLDDIIPIHYNGTELLTGLTMNYLEDLGLLKMDFLSLRNLTTMANILKLIKDNTGKKIDINRINLNDPKVLNMFQLADTVGVFQFESEGMKNFLRKLKPNRFSDIVAAIALYRPGPMENIDTFIRRKEGLEKVTYLHPDLKDILEETYGIIVYQEQVMQILVKVGGFTFAMADTIRRAMSKKKKEVIESGQASFLNGALQKGYSASLANEIYDLILKFANYGFNKSHSVSYSLIGYQMAYLKCYFPIYYIANLLNMNVDSIDKTREYIALAKHYNITFLKPSVNESTLSYKITGSQLQLPLIIIKNLGIEAAKAIIKERENHPYQDFFDFVAKTYGKSVNKKTIEALIMAGALDNFNENHNTLKANIDNAINYATLVGDLDESFVMKPSMVSKEESTAEEKREEEYQTYGFYISNHPASKYIDPKIMKLEHINENYDKHINCVVMIEKIKEITTKKQERMAFVTASDETSTGNFVVFASGMKELDNVKIGEIVYIEGRVARRFADYQININKIQSLKEGVK